MGGVSYGGGSLLVGEVSINIYFFRAFILHGIKIKPKAVCRQHHRQTTMPIEAHRLHPGVDGILSASTYDTQSALILRARGMSSLFPDV